MVTLKDKDPSEVGYEIMEDYNLEWIAWEAQDWPKIRIPLEIGMDYEKKFKNTSNALKGHFDVSKVSPKKKIVEFRNFKDEFSDKVKLGMEINIKDIFNEILKEIIHGILNKILKGILKEMLDGNP